LERLSFAVSFRAILLDNKFIAKNFDNKNFVITFDNKFIAK